MGSFERIVRFDLTPSESFTSFVKEVEPRLKRALCVGFGIESGVEATADALAYGWEHWDRIRDMDNPAGYLYQVGRSRTRARRTPRPTFPALPAEASRGSSPASPLLWPGCRSRSDRRCGWCMASSGRWTRRRRCWMSRYRRCANTSSVVRKSFVQHWGCRHDRTDRSSAP